MELLFFIGLAGVIALLFWGAKKEKKTVYKTDAEVVRERINPLDENPRYKKAPRSVTQWGRNEPCWCGSGIKAKKCHGRTKIERDNQVLVRNDIYEEKYKGKYDG